MVSKYTVRPVLAHRVEVTAESIPPEIPTTNPFIPACSQQAASQSTICSITFSVCIRFPPRFFRFSPPDRFQPFGLLFLVLRLGLFPSGIVRFFGRRPPAPKCSEKGFQPLNPVFFSVFFMHYRITFEWRQI